MIYLILLIWILYALIEGKREAIFWHHRIHSTDYKIFKSIDRHPLFMLQRGLFLLVIGITFYYITDNIWWALYFIGMNSLIFSFFHNGSLYTERHQMDKKVHPMKGKWVYPKKWWDQSTTSTAVLTKFMNPISRTIQMIIGLIGYMIYTILK